MNTNLLVHRIFTAGNIYITANLIKEQSDFLC